MTPSSFPQVPPRLLAGLCATVLLLGTVAAVSQSGDSDEALQGPPAAGAPSPTRASTAPGQAATTTPAAAPKKAQQPRTSTRPAAPTTAAPVPGRTRTVPAGPAALPPLAWRSGAFSGGSTAEHVAFGTWRGRPLGSALWFMAQDSWPAMENPEYWAKERAKSPSALPVLSYALWPTNEKDGSLAVAASGEYDVHWERLARNLVAQGMADAVIRPGWEFNGNWYPWSLLNDEGAANFAEAFRHIVDSMRSVEGQRFQFSWNPVASGGSVDPAKAYPGDDYVDDIGLDVYNVKLRPGFTSAQQWDSLVSMKYGLAWHKAFADRHGKKVSYPEWGAFSRPKAPAGTGGDDPRFIRNMFTWMKANPPAYENYFDHDTPDGTFYGLHTPSSVMPVSARTYKSLWGR